MGQKINLSMKQKNKRKRSYTVICFGDLNYIILPSLAISINPKKCMSLRELQTTNSMLTVCKPSISHSSLKNTNMIPTHNKSSSCLHPMLPTSHRLPHSQPYTLSLFVDLQRRVCTNVFALFLFTFLLPSWSVIFAVQCERRITSL